MTIRRAEYLINDTRLSTDNLDTNKIKDREFLRYYNDGIKMIQLIIFKANPLCAFFGAESVYNTVSPDTDLDLPEDCYAHNAINTVEARFGVTEINQGYRRLKRVYQETRADFFGYFTRNKKLIVTGYNLNQQIDNLRLTYFKKEPRFDKRWGKISGIVGNVISLTEATDSDLSLLDDTISIVDINGAVIQANIKVTTYTLPTSITTLTALLGSVASGQYIVSGGYSTTLCSLPDEVEPYLQSYVEFSVKNRNNYNDAVRQKAWTDEQKNAIISLFSNNTKELVAPPITDTDFLEI